MNAYQIKTAGARSKSNLLAIPEIHNNILYVRLLFNSKAQQTFLIRADLLLELGRRITEENKPNPENSPFHENTLTDLLEKVPGE